ncbi:hypothetical protein [Nocardia sp. SC052]|uniref:hypothetical protein n=1 Tax=Nocardia sichangensis TaxID=3385975 RepID=UPI0039A3A85D
MSLGTALQKDATAPFVVRVAAQVRTKHVDARATRACPSQAPGAIAARRVE